MAHVHCVIIGFSMEDNDDKLIIDGDNIIHAKNINFYLNDASDVVVESRNKPICNVPPMVYGNKPADGGYLILSDSEYWDYISIEPQGKKFIKPLLGAEEFLNNKKRWCFWLVNANPMEIAKCPLLTERIRLCKEKRESSIAAGIRKFAKTPTLFAQVTQPEGVDYLIVPCTSSEKRKYIPIGFMSSETKVTNLVQIIPNATLYEFGILTSIVHNAWMRVVAGRLKSDYRYSKDIVYNNFPWPSSIDNGQLTIDNAAQKILDIREKYLSEGASLATLYGENLDLLFTDLAEAHRELDAVVLGLYGLKKDATEAEMVARLFEMIL